MSCFIKIQNALTFLVPAYPGCPGKEAAKQVSVSEFTVITWSSWTPPTYDNHVTTLKLFAL